MPRKTITSLEAEIERLIRARNELAEALDTERRAHHEAVKILETERARYSTNIYLTYQPSGDVELDALQVAGRAIESLQDPLARDRCAAYLADRFSQIRED